MSEDQEHGEHQEHSGFGDLKTTLGKKAGPLPMGVWILAIGGGLVLAYVMRSRSSAANSDPGTTSSGAEAGADDWNYGASNGVGQNGTSGGATDTSPVTITTNEQWQRRAVQVLVGMGYEATAVDRAIGNYLGGNSLTTVERAIVNEAILRIGPPPISPPPPPTSDQPPPVITPPPDTKPPATVPPTPVVVKPPPVVHHYPERKLYHVHVPGDNYTKIAQMYGTGLSGAELRAYQFTPEAGRSAKALADIRARGDKIMPGGSTAVPYPK